MTLFRPKVRDSIMTDNKNTKGAIGIRKLKKNRQHNGQNKKYKRTINDLQNRE